MVDQQSYLVRVDSRKTVFRHCKAKVCDCLCDGSNCFGIIGCGRMGLRRAARNFCISRLGSNRPNLCRIIYRCRRCASYPIAFRNPDAYRDSGRICGDDNYRRRKGYWISLWAKLACRSFALLVELRLFRFASRQRSGSEHLRLLRVGGVGTSILCTFKRKSNVAQCRNHSRFNHRNCKLRGICIHGVDIDGVRA